VSSPASTEIAIVGCGVAGTLVARELVDAGKEVLVVERGGFKPHAAQVRDGTHEDPLPTGAHNHEPHPDTPGDPWEYVYGVGGSGLHWGGVTPRLMPSDFELRTRYGVGRDWPLGYAELAPFYDEAERALSVAGAPIELFGSGYRPPLPPHPFAPVDRLISPHLEPYYHLAQARPTRSVGGRAACCGSGQCQLCLVDARYSPLHTLAGVRRRPGFRLQTGLVVAQIRRDGSRAWQLECVDGRGDGVSIRARTVVVAANGFENAAILLRSRLGGDDVGRWLFDHEYAVFEIEVSRPYPAGVASTIATGISYAWADGDWRGRRGSQLLYPENRGSMSALEFVDAIVAGRRGAQLQRELVDRFRRRIVLNVSGEDLPQAGRRVELSPNTDGLGLPLNRIRYAAESPYLARSREVVHTDLDRRLRPIGGRIVGVTRFRGGHQLGTCRMGDGDGVVDRDCRLHGAESLYVVGGSAFPSYSAAHPTLTIAALAIRLGRHLAAAS
jgi:glucose dehydrogenase